MPDLISLKIDCTKIEKSRLFHGKNGAKYLDAVLIPSTNSKYGDDYMIVQGVSKEEREAGTRGPILGNARILKSDNKQAARPESKPEAKDENDDVPF